jgi:DNA-binding HxlR family transcriptional regulator
MSAKMVADGLVPQDKELTSEQMDALNGLAKEIFELDAERFGHVRGILSLLGDSWSSLILFVLACGRIRHSAMRRSLHALSQERQISQRMLTLKLRAFERYGLLERRVSEDVPPKVDYALTEKGYEFAIQAQNLIHWIHNHGPRPEDWEGQSHFNLPPPAAVGR